MPPLPAAATAPQIHLPHLWQIYNLEHFDGVCMKSIDNGVDPSIENKDGVTFEYAQQREQ
jgi:hypothetical protein